MEDITINKVPFNESWLNTELKDNASVEAVSICCFMNELCGGVSLGKQKASHMEHMLCVSCSLSDSCVYGVQIACAVWWVGMGRWGRNTLAGAMRMCNWAWIQWWGVDLRRLAKGRGIGAEISRLIGIN